MRITRLAKAAPYLALISLMLSACAPAQTATAPKAAAPSATATVHVTTTSTAPTPSPKPAPGQPQYGGILTVGIGGDPPTLDVHQEESSFTYGITAGTYNNLLKPDAHAWPEFKLVPDLASSWEVSPDGKVYTFNLVKGAKFHDGTPVTAEDVRFSLDRIRNPQKGMAKSPRKAELKPITNIDTPDDNTVKVTLSHPQGYFLPLLATVFFAIMPKHVVEANGNDMRKIIVGSGAFKFKNYSSGVSWELVKNSDYFVKDRPYLDGVKGYIIKDPFARFAALRTKNILWWAPFPYMSVSQTKIIEEQMADKIALKWEFHPAWYGTIFNLSQAPWSDVRVRQAVTMAFDRKRMVATGLEGAGIVGMSPQPPGEWALPEEEMMKVPGYAKPDIEGAKKLLAEAGFPNGLKSEMLVRAVKVHEDTGLVIKDALAAIGIDLNLKVQETAVYQDAQYKKQFGISEGGVSSKVQDPDVTLGDFYVTNAGRNWGGYSNPEYDQLHAKESATLDAAERRKIVFEMQRILLRDVPIAIAYWVRVPYVWWKEVNGFSPPVETSNSYPYQEMWLAK